MRWIWDWARYHNSHSSKSIRVTKLSFGQNDLPRSTPFWQKNILVTLILFELRLLCYLAQSQIHRITLYFLICTYLNILVQSQIFVMYQSTQWRHKSKKFENLGRCGRQNILWPYLKFGECELIFSCAVKAIYLTGVCIDW